jgi:hypothetical protein
MSKPILITCQPDDQYFLWQNHLYIDSCLEQGFEEEQIHILLYKPSYREANTNWKMLKECHPKINIFLYEDMGVQNYLGIYIPVIRPHILWQHFKKFPELQEKTIIYTDCDILWTSNLNIEKFYNDNNCYISDASSYLNYSYFESKKKDILEDKRAEAEGEDFLGSLCNIVGIPKKKVVENDNNTGGVQYILKNVDAVFWKKVELDVLNIRTYLLSVNKHFYANENAGIQSWCADLWAVLWNLWLRDGETKVVPEMEFAWSSDNISKLEKVGILHNAGIVSNYQGDIPTFYKGNYHKGNSPFDDPHVSRVLNDEKSKTLCSHHYVKKLFDLKQKYNLNY